MREAVQAESISGWCDHQSRVRDVKGGLLAIMEMWSISGTDLD